METNVNPFMKQAYYWARGPFYRHMYPTYDAPISPQPNYGWLTNPSIPRIDPNQFRAEKPTTFNPFHAGLFNEYSKNMDVASPAYVDEFVTVPQSYDDSNSYDLLNSIRNGPKNKLDSYYARNYGSTAKPTDEYITGSQTESSQNISTQARLWGSTLPTLLANYGVKNVLLTGGLIGGLAGLGYGGYKAYNWWRNRNPKPVQEHDVPMQNYVQHKPKISVDAGVNITSKELSNDDEYNRPTNITFSPADAETKAKIRRLVRNY